MRSKVKDDRDKDVEKALAAERDAKKTKESASDALTSQQEEESKSRAGCCGSVRCVSSTCRGLIAFNVMGICVISRFIARYGYAVEDSVCAVLCTI